MQRDRDIPQVALLCRDQRPWNRASWPQQSNRRSSPPSRSSVSHALVLRKPITNRIQDLTHIHTINLRINQNNEPQPLAAAIADRNSEGAREPREPELRIETREFKRGKNEPKNPQRQCVIWKSSVICGCLYYLSAA